MGDNARDRLKAPKRDGQLVELAGRNWLCSQLVLAGLEVARPERDHGIDLIAYIDKAAKRFVACPIQMKGATNESFSIHKRYKSFPSLLHVYVWHLGEPSRTVAYALTFSEAETIARKMGWTERQSWLKEEGNPGWSTNYIGEDLRKLLCPFMVTGPKDWMDAVNRCAQ